MTVGASLAIESARLLGPLRYAFSSGLDLRTMLRDMGWYIELDGLVDDVIADIPGAATLVQEVETAIGLADRLADRGDEGQELIELVETIAAIHDAIEELAGFNPSDLAADLLGQLVGRLTDTGFWIDLALDLPEYLVVRYLRIYHAPLYGALRMFAVIEDDVRPGVTQVPGEDRTYSRLIWDRLLALLRGEIDPTATAPDRMVSEIDRATTALGLLTRYGPVVEPVASVMYNPGHNELPAARQVSFPIIDTIDGATSARFEALLAQVPTTGPAGAVDGLYLTANVAGSLDTEITVADAWTLTLGAGADLSGTAGITIGPNGVAAHRGNPPVTAELGLTLTGRRGTPWRFPAEGEIGIGLAEAVLRVDLSNDPPSLSTVLDLTGVQVEISTAGQDSFLSELINVDLAVAADIEIAWSPTDGLSLDLRQTTPIGLLETVTGQFSTTVPLNFPIGPVTLETLHLTAGIDPGLTLDVALDVSALLGPFGAVAEGIGLSVAIDPVEDAADGDIGPFAIGMVLEPPTTIVFALESEAVSGGGFITIDPEQGRYAGGFALDILGFGISAIVIVDTQLPPGSGGWALFASIGAEFPAPIPIGFGFTLIGVGGVLALNRTMDTDELALGLKSGAADSLLFPDDILTDASAVLDGLDRWLPIMPDSLVVGPVVKIGWGSPVTLVTIEMGVMVALPDLIFTLLGSLEVLLPVPEAPILSLRMDFLGTVDVASGTVMVVASLHDSNLLGIYELSGETGFYLSVGERPLFVLSIGGYHPQFTPPGALPAAMHDLDRTRAAIDLGDLVEISITSYVAVTSNTVQFGGQIDVMATVKFLGTTYTALGWFGVNLLLILRPFKLVADASIGATVTAGGRELMGVELSVRIEGPEPWFATGRAYFKFFGLPVDFEFDIGSKLSGQARELHDVTEDVVLAMGDDSAWTALDVSDEWASGVTISDELPAGLWVRPDQDVELRQSVAPLNRTITAFGEMAPTEPAVDADDVRIGGSKVAEPTWVEDWFAPAQFDRLGETARLSAPSYESMTAGVRFGDDEVAISTNIDRETASVSRAPETDVGDPLAGYVSPTIGIAVANDVWHVQGPRLTVAATAYTVVRSIDGVATSNRSLGYAEAVGRAEAMTATAEPGSASVIVVPDHDVRERRPR